MAIFRADGRKIEKCQQDKISQQRFGKIIFRLNNTFTNGNTEYVLCAESHMTEFCPLFLKKMIRSSPVCQFITRLYRRFLCSPHSGRSEFYTTSNQNTERFQKKIFESGHWLLNRYEKIQIQ